MNSKDVPVDTILGLESGIHKLLACSKSLGIEEGRPGGLVQACRGKQIEGACKVWKVTSPH